jgi:hypothetical protein
MTSITFIFQFLTGSRMNLRFSRTEDQSSLVTIIIHIVVTTAFLLTTMSIFAINTSPEASGPMISSTAVNLIADVGIENDRYAKMVGTYSCLKASTLQPGQREPGRQVTMISADDLDAAVQRSGIPLSDYGGFRRNIVVRGMAQKPLIGAHILAEIEMKNDERVTKESVIPKIKYCDV